MWIKFKENVLLDVSKFDSIVVIENYDERSDNISGWRLIGKKNDNKVHTIGIYKTKKEAMSNFSIIKKKLVEVV